MRLIPGTLLSVIFPDDCRVCGSALQNFSRIPVCDACLASPSPFVAEFFCTSCRTPFLNAAPLDELGRCRLCSAGLTGFDAALSYGEYEGSLRKLIHLFKYGQVLPLAKPMAKLLASALPRDTSFDCIVPMPMHWRRQWSRGFNQSEVLARALGNRTGIAVKNAVRRSKATPAQAGLTNAERRTNVAGAFRIRSREAIVGKHVLLIDDVFTTGATASACAAVLKRAGARRVTVLTLARVDRRSSSSFGSAAR